MSSKTDVTGSDQDIAEELADSQRDISIAEFFEKNKHMLGFDSPGRALFTAIKEAVDNAFDACEEAGYFPEVLVEVEQSGDYYRLIVEDNGPGITKEQIPNVFGKLLHGSRFGSRTQSRGQQGIGISAAVMYAKLSSGKSTRVVSKTPSSDVANEFVVSIDTDRNEPEIESEGTIEDWGREHGTRIEMELEANMRARSQLHNYIERTAVVNPHAKVTFDEPNINEKIVYEKSENAELPEETEEIKPHPYGVELGTLLDMMETTDSYSLSGFFQEDFTRVGAKSAEKMLNNFRDHQFGRELPWEDDADSLTDSLREYANSATSSRKTGDILDTFAEELSDCLIDHDDLVSKSELRTFVNNAADTASEVHDKGFGDTAKENIFEEVWPELTSVDQDVPTVSEATDDRDTAANLIAGMRATDGLLSPPDKCLAPIHESNIEEGLKKVYDSADKYFTATRDPEAAAGDPFVVEAGIAYGGDIETDGEAVEVLRFANRVPLVYQRGACSITDVVKDIRWRNYNLDQPGDSGIPKGDAVLMVHVASTNVPFTSESKDAVANVPEIEDEIEAALREAARGLKKYTNKRQKQQKAAETRNKLNDIYPAITKKVSDITGNEPREYKPQLAKNSKGVYVGIDEKKSTLVVRNHAPRNHNPEVTASFESPTSLDDTTEVNGAEVSVEGNSLVLSGTLKPGDSWSLSIEFVDEPSVTISVDGVSEEVLTIDEQ